MGRVRVEAGGGVGWVDILLTAVGVCVGLLLGKVNGLERS